MKLIGNIFVLLFYAASLISGSAFFHRLYKERRSMWTGTLLSLFLLSLFFSSVFTPKVVKCVLKSSLLI